MIKTAITIPGDYLNAEQRQIFMHAQLDALVDTYEGFVKSEGIARLYPETLPAKLPGHTGSEALNMYEYLFEKLRERGISTIVTSYEVSQYDGNANRYFFVHKDADLSALNESLSGFVYDPVCGADPAHPKWKYWEPKPANPLDVSVSIKRPEEE